MPPGTCVDLGSYRVHPWCGPAARRGAARPEIEARQDGLFKGVQMAY